MEIRRVISGWDGAAGGRDALRLAALFAQAADAELVVAHVGADATAKLADAEAALPYGARASFRAVEEHSVIDGLIGLAEEEAADLIVLGTDTRGPLAVRTLGSMAERIAHEGPCAVAVAPQNFANEENPGLRVIGVAYDGTRESMAAVETASELALRSGAAIKLIQVSEPVRVAAAGISSAYAFAETTEGAVDAIRADLESVAEGLPKELRVEAILARGDAGPEIAERAQILSLVVLGTHGYGPLRRMLFGSVSAPLLRSAPCPVLVVPARLRAVAEATP